MTATEKLNQVLAAIPVLTSYVFFYRALGLTDDEIIARLKAVVDQVTQERL